MDEDHRKMYAEFMKDTLEQPCGNPEAYKLIGKELANNLIETFQHKYACSKDDAVKIIVEGAMLRAVKPLDPVKDSPTRNLKEHFDAQPCYVEERLYMSEKSFKELFEEVKEPADGE
jgi:hypothetical protein